jgi:putative heme degradation protein
MVDVGTSKDAYSNHWGKQKSVGMRDPEWVVNFFNDRNILQLNHEYTKKLWWVSEPSDNGLFISHQQTAVELLHQVHTPFNKMQGRLDSNKK